jgi:hypothetical protein
MDNNSTRNSGRLSLAKRAAQGLLRSELTLPLFEILLLEHPDNTEAHNRLNHVIQRALKSGELSGTRNAISQGNFAAWRARCCETSLLNNKETQIYEWLGLPLNKRARRGSLVTETELPVWEILELEFPADDYHEPSNEYLHWQKVIETALHRGLLVSRPETQITQGETCLTGDWLIWLIDRESYRQWLTSKANPPANSDICAWLGATPPAESIPPVETSLPKPPVSTARPASVANPEKRQRNDALNHAIRAALAVLSPSGGPLPRPPALFTYLAHNDTTKTVKGVAKGNRALLWVDDNNNEQSLTVSALRKRLDRIRQSD